VDPIECGTAVELGLFAGVLHFASGDRDDEQVTCAPPNRPVLFGRRRSSPSDDEKGLRGGVGLRRYRFVDVDPDEGRHEVRTRRSAAVTFDVHVLADVEGDDPRRSVLVQFRRVDDDGDRLQFLRDMKEKRMIIIAVSPCTRERLFPSTSSEHPSCRRG